MSTTSQTVLSVVAPTAGTYQVAVSLDATVGLLGPVSCHIAGGSAPNIVVSVAGASVPIPVTDAVTVAADGDSISVDCSRTGVLGSSSINSGEINAILVAPPA